MSTYVGIRYCHSPMQELYVFYLETVHQVKNRGSLLKRYGGEVKFHGGKVKFQTWPTICNG